MIYEIKLIKAITLTVDSEAVTDSVIKTREGALTYVKEDLSFAESEFETESEIISIQ